MLPERTNKVLMKLLLLESSAQKTVNTVSHTHVHRGNRNLRSKEKTTILNPK